MQLSGLLLSVHVTVPSGRWPSSVRGDQPAATSGAVSPRTPVAASINTRSICPDPVASTMHAPPVNVDGGAPGLPVLETWEDADVEPGPIPSLS